MATKLQAAGDLALKAVQKNAAFLKKAALKHSYSVLQNSLAWLFSGTRTAKIF